MNERVKGYGPDVSPLMIIGDYPTAEDLKLGKCFTGESAKLTDHFLRSNNYSLEKCYKTTFIKTAVPGYGTKSKKRNREALENVFQIANWIDILIEEIRAIQPNVILALGELPLNFLCQEKSIDNFRGSILPLAPAIREKIGLEKNIRVVPTLGSRYIFTDPTSRVYVTLDYKKALRFLHDKSPLREPGILRIIRTGDQLRDYWRDARYGDFLVTDIETAYNLPSMASICTDGELAVTFPLLNYQTDTENRADLWSVYDEILRSPIPKVNQNITFDWSILEECGFTIRNIVGDTMLMAHTLYPELPKGLGFLTSIYTDIPYYKDEGREYNPLIHDPERQLYYNAKDSLATWQIWRAQQSDAEDMGVKNFYFNYVQKFLPHYKKINERGILIDDTQRLKLWSKYENLLEQHQEEINLALGKPLNVRSPQQVGRFVYDYLKCPIHTHLTPSGEIAYSTDEDTIINMYLNEVTNDAIKMLLRQIILCRKILSAINLITTPFHLDGRMRTSYKLGGTTTGRTSTSQSPGYYLGFVDGKVDKVQFGTAFQKIGKRGFEFEKTRYGADIRSMFVPSPGYEFFALDGKNAEGRVVCVLGEDWETLEYIETGGDLHRLTASWIYGNKPLKFISKDERDMGKMCRHAGNLGQGAAGLSMQVHLSVKTCEEVMKRFHKNAPNVRQVFQRQVEQLIEKQRFMVNPFGRKRYFYNLDSRNKHDVFEKGYSFLPQGTVSDHFKIVSLAIAEAAGWSYQLGEFHDGLLYEIPIGRREEFADIVLKETSRKIDFRECSMSRNYELQIPVEMEASEDNWYNMPVIGETPPLRGQTKEEDEVA